MPPFEEYFCGFSCDPSMGQIEEDGGEQRPISVVDGFSSKIPESQVAEFSLALGVEYKLINNPQQQCGKRGCSK